MANLSVLEKVALPVTTMSPIVTLPTLFSANVTGIDIVFISTSQDSSGMGTSLSGPVKMQVMVKLSPAVGVPGIDMV